MAQATPCTPRSFRFRPCVRCTGLQLGLLSLVCLLLVPGAVQASPYSESARLEASDAVAVYLFGFRVALDGDTLIASAVAPNGGQEDGAAYAFQRSGGVWSEQQRLIATDAAAGDRFGTGLAIAGDTAVVGAPGDDDGATNAGSVYIFTRSGGTWTETQKLTASDGAQSDAFGDAVAMSGDTLIVGAPNGSEPAEKGAAYVFVRSGGVWTEQQKLTVSDVTAQALFGGRVALDGDTAVVGAYFDATSAGSAHVFVRSAGVWTRQEKLTAPDAAPFDRFGISVAVSGDTALVGADSDDADIGNRGSFYAFDRTGTTWSLAQQVTGSGQAKFLGTSIAMNGDLAVVGATGTFVSGTSSGAAFVYARSGGTWSEQEMLAPSVPDSGDGFGVSAALSGDAIAIGAHGDDNAKGTLAGSVYIFDCGSPNLAPTADAGPDQAVNAGDTVNLDGTGSFDDNTETPDLGYAWSFVSVPAGSTATLAGAATDTPSFTADEPGTYEVQLIVTDEEGLASAPDTVCIASVNLPPTADAGLDQVIELDEIAGLDGSASSDPNGDAITYSWTIASAPAGSTAVLASAGSVNPTLSPDLEGTYVIRLVVNDGLEDSAPDDVEVVVIGPVYALESLACASTHIGLMQESSFDAPGHRNSLTASINRVIKFIQKGEVEKALQHLRALIERTDGCALRGQPDPMGGGQPFAGDHVVDCDDQSVIYGCLTEALEAID